MTSLPGLNAGIEPATTRARLHIGAVSAARSCLTGERDVPTPEVPYEAGYR